MPDKKAVGFLGLGKMGLPMARNVLNAGYPMVVYNRSASKAQEFVDKGATLAKSPRHVAESCDLFITMLADELAVEDVMNGENGILKAAHSGQVWVDMSTVSPMFSRKMAQYARVKGVKMLDAPVLGSIKPAAEGMLMIFGGGDHAVFDDVLPVLETMGKEVFYLGGTGMGTSMKLCMNLLLGVFMAGLSESLLLANKSGIRNEQYQKVIEACSIVSPGMKSKVGAILAGDFTPHFTLKHMKKDLMLILDTAGDLGINLPVSEQALERFSSAYSAGHADQDYSALAAHALHPEEQEEAE